METGPLLDHHAAVARVRDLLRDGWVAVHTLRGPRWLLERPGHQDQQVRTPADGQVLDELLFWDLDTGRGDRHPHVLRGRTYHHQHDAGDVDHAHHPTPDGSHDSQ